MSTTHKKAFGDPQLVAVQLDWSGAIEATFQYQGAAGYAWPLTKTVNGQTLRRVSVTETSDFVNEGYIISKANYRGRGFGRDAVSIEGTVNSEPITAHPQFASIAGTVEEPITTDAIWEQRNGVNTFVQFKDDSTHAGIENFLSAEWNATVEWYSTTIVSVFQPATIYALPTTECFEDTSGYDWLCSSVSQQPHGGAYRISAQLIGAANWPAEIYTT